MSIISNGRAPIKSKVTPVAKTVTLYSSEWRTVMPKFGQGVLPSRQNFRLPCTLDEFASTGALFADYHSDSTWDQESDAAYDQRAFEAEAIERVVGGCIL